jgi:adenylyl cyclase-associated protein
MNAVFKELNQGDKITAGLRKVTDDMKTKNRSDRGGFVPDAPAGRAAVGAPPKASSATKTPAAKPPKVALEGKKWSVEHHVGNKTLLIEGVTSKQTVYVYDCKDCVVTIEGKPNAITFDACVKTAAIFSDVLATCELVNCRSVQVQCLGSVPTVSIDKVDGCQVFLGEKSYGAAVLTAKSSEVNVVCVPNEGADDEPQETPVPEQFVTTRGADGKWTTVPFTGH